MSPTLPDTSSPPATSESIYKAGIIDIRLLTVSINHTPVTLHYVVRNNNLPANIPHSSSAIPNHQDPTVTPQTHYDPQIFFILREIDAKLLRTSSNPALTTITVPQGGNSSPVIPPHIHTPAIPKVLNPSTRTEQCVRTVVNLIAKGEHVWATPEELRAFKVIGIATKRAPRAALLPIRSLIYLLRYFLCDITALILEAVLLTIQHEMIVLRTFLHSQYDQQVALANSGPRTLQDMLEAFSSPIKPPQTATLDGQSQFSINHICEKFIPNLLSLKLGEEIEYNLHPYYTGQWLFLSQYGLPNEIPQPIEISSTPASQDSQITAASKRTPLTLTLTSETSTVGPQNNSAALLLDNLNQFHQLQQHRPLHFIDHDPNKVIHSENPNITLPEGPLIISSHRNVQFHSNIPLSTGLSSASGTTVTTTTTSTPTVTSSPQDIIDPTQSHLFQYKINSFIAHSVLDTNIYVDYMYLPTKTEGMQNSPHQIPHTLSASQNQSTQHCIIHLNLMHDFPCALHDHRVPSKIGETPGNCDSTISTSHNFSAIKHHENNIINQYLPDIYTPARLLTNPNAVTMNVMSFKLPCLQIAYHYRSTILPLLFLIANNSQIDHTTINTNWLFHLYPLHHMRQLAHKYPLPPNLLSSRGPLTLNRPVPSPSQGSSSKDGPVSHHREHTEANNMFYYINTLSNLFSHPSLSPMTGYSTQQGTADSSLFLSLPGVVPFSTLFALAAVYFRLRNPTIPQHLLITDDTEPGIGEDGIKLRIHYPQNTAQHQHLAEIGSLARLRYQFYTFMSAMHWILSTPLVGPVTYSVTLIEFNPIEQQSLYLGVPWNKDSTSPLSTNYYHINSPILPPPPLENTIPSQDGQNFSNSMIKLEDPPPTPIRSSPYDPIPDLDVIIHKDYMLSKRASPVMETTTTAEYVRNDKNGTTSDVPSPTSTDVQTGPISIIEQWLYDLLPPLDPHTASPSPSPVHQLPISPSALIRNTTQIISSSEAIRLRLFRHAYCTRNIYNAAHTATLVTQLTNAPNVIIEEDEDRAPPKRQRNNTGLDSGELVQIDESVHDGPARRVTRSRTKPVEEIHEEEYLEPLPMKPKRKTPIRTEKAPKPPTKAQLKKMIDAETVQSPAPQQYTPLNMNPLPLLQSIAPQPPSEPPQFQQFTTFPQPNHPQYASLPPQQPRQQPHQQQQLSAHQFTYPPSTFLKPPSPQPVTLMSGTPINNYNIYAQGQNIPKNSANVGTNTNLSLTTTRSPGNYTVPTTLPSQQVAMTSQQFFTTKPQTGVVAGTNPSALPFLNRLSANPLYTHTAYTPHNPNLHTTPINTTTHLSTTQPNKVGLLSTAPKPFNNVMSTTNNSVIGIAPNLMTPTPFHLNNQSSTKFPSSINVPSGSSIPLQTSSYNTTISFQPRTQIPQGAGFPQFQHPQQLQYPQRVVTNPSDLSNVPRQ